MYLICGVVSQGCIAARGSHNRCAQPVLEQQWGVGRTLQHYGNHRANGEHKSCQYPVTRRNAALRESETLGRRVWLPTSPAPEICWPLPAREVLLELNVSFRRDSTDNKLRQSWIMALGDALPNFWSLGANRLWFCRAIWAAYCC